MRLNDIMEGHTYARKDGCLTRTVTTIGDLFVYYRSPGMTEDMGDCRCLIETFGAWAREDVTENADG